MSSELTEFVKAYIAAVHKRFDEAVLLNKAAVTEGDRAFFDGAFFCYQDTMKILKAELEAKGFSTSELEPIIPEAPSAVSVVVSSQPDEIL
ncbi:MAG: hypothetical protein ACFB5Z_08400 [Elainellaceae cyanobacterium]